MKTYKFVTIWRIKAPIESVWKEIYHSKDWPTWWKGVESVVEVCREMMNLLAPFARALFEWNHNVVMSWGAKGLAKRLGVPVVEQT